MQNTNYEQIIEKCEYDESLEVEDIDLEEMDEGINLIQKQHSVENNDVG